MQIQQIFVVAFVIIGTYQISDSLVKKRINDHIEKFDCKGTSPVFNIKYGNKNIIQHKSELFCPNEAQRTCCNSENFDTLKSSWYLFNYNHRNISSSCQIQFNELICMDCDSDIGLNLRQGLCPHKCTQFYNACQDDLFKIDESVQTRIKYCNNNDVMCSPLKYIIEPENDTEFCQKMGFPVNTHSDYQVWNDDLRIKTNQTDFNPVCWDGVSSYKYFGAAKEKGNSTSSRSRSTKHRKQKWQISDFIIPGCILFLVIILIGVFIYIMVIRKKQEEVYENFRERKTSNNSTSDQGSPNTNQNRPQEAFKGKPIKLD